MVFPGQIECDKGRCGYKVLEEHSWTLLEESHHRPGYLVEKGFGTIRGGGEEGLSIGKEIPRHEASKP